MANVRFNARHGVSVGTTPVDVIDASGNATVSTLLAGSGTFSAGARVSGAMSLGASGSPGSLSYENPIFREYIGDGTGYSRTFSKRTGAVTTDFVVISDATGAILVQNSQFPTLTSGQGAIYANVGNGLVLGGYGSSADVTVLDKIGVTRATFTSTGLSLGTGALTAGGGTFGDGTTSPIVSVNSSSAGFANYSFRTAGVVRWAVEKSGTESGSDAGGNLNFYRYSDTGSYLGTALTLNRATGLVTANSGLSVTGSGTFSGTVAGTSFNSITGLQTTTPLPLINGTATIGTSAKVAREDHVHPTDTTRAATSGTLAQFAATTSTQLASVISDETGSGALVFATSPTLTTPSLGVATATTINKVTLTAPATASTLTIADGKTLTASNTLTLAGTDASTLNIGTGGTLGTAAYTASTAYSPVAGSASLVTTGAVTGTSFNSITGLQTTTPLPLINGTATIGTSAKVAREDHVHPTDTTRAATSGTLAQFAATTSTQLAGVISDETGSGSLVFATSPSLTTPSLGVATATTINKVTLTAPVTGSTLTIADGKTLTASNTLTLAGTDASTLNIGTGGTLGTAAYTASTAYSPVAGSTSLVTTGAVTGTSFNSITGLQTTTPLPLINGTATIGTSAKVAREDHVHPTDTTRAATSGTLAQFAATTSAQLAGVISDETGSGSLVFATSPSLTAPSLGVATATTINKVTLTAPVTGSTLTIADGKTLTASNTITLSGTDASTLNIGTGGTLGTAAYTASTAYAPLGHTTDPGNAHPASAITNTPAGNIAATTVQAAINELDSQDLGFGQTVTFNGAGITRVPNTTYTNATGKPIFVSITCRTTNAATAVMSFNFDGSAQQQVAHTLPTAGALTAYSFIVKPGGSYNYADGNGGVQTQPVWYELR